jgi:hypothetical protein
MFPPERSVRDATGIVPGREITVKDRDRDRTDGHPGGNRRTRSLSKAGRVPRPPGSAPPRGFSPGLPSGRPPRVEAGRQGDPWRD